MIKCRTCLKAEENLKMYPFSITIIVYLNLLTDINVQLDDNLPQQICEHCLDMVNLFIEFRNKCILSNSVLLDNNTYDQDIKEENKDSNDTNIKEEKSDFYIFDTSDGVHSNVDYEYIHELELKEKQFEGANNDELEGKSKNKLVKSFSCGLCVNKFEDINSLVEHLDIHKINGDNICALCKQYFPHWQELFSHRLVHLSKRNDKICHICLKKFINPTLLESHYKKKHEMESILICQLCKQSYTTSKELQEHRDGCHAKKSLICNYCSKIFLNQRQLKLHVTEHTERKTVKDVIEKPRKNIGSLEVRMLSLEINDIASSKQKKNDLKVENSSSKCKKIKKLETELFCGLCEKKYESSDSLSEHLDSHKQSNDITCYMCAETFKDWTQLFAHRLQHLPPKQKTCHICFKGFRSHVYLEHHYKKIHCNNEKATLSCLTCGKSYTTPRKLQKHVWRSHSNNKFSCDFCSKTYSHKCELRQHIKGHMGRETLACDQCDYTTKFSSNLKEHKIRKHIPKRVYCKVCSRVFPDQHKCDAHKCNIKSLICSICGKTFTGNKQLARHMVSHESAGRYRCARCPAHYRSRVALATHTARHDGVRAHRCPRCPAAFFSLSVLVKHQRIHTGIKPYVCKICQKAFTGNNNLKVHMKIHGEYLITKKVKKDQHC